MILPPGQYTGYKDSLSVPSRDRHIYAVNAFCDVFNSSGHDDRSSPSSAGSTMAPSHVELLGDVVGGGGWHDWAYGRLGCVHSYTVELPPSMPHILEKSNAGSLKGAAFKDFLHHRDPLRSWKRGMCASGVDKADVGARVSRAVVAMAAHVVRLEPAR